MADYPRPAWVNTRGMRNAPDTVPFDPFTRYENIAMGIYEWGGTPDDMPPGYIEKILFQTGCVGVKDVPGLGVCVMPANPKTRNIYGEPKAWLPGQVDTTGSPLPAIFSQVSENPCLYIGTPASEIVEMYATIMYHTMQSLRQNVIGLSQPIAINGDVGNIADGLVLKNEITQGALAIPVINAKGIGAEVLDLKARDYTQSLIATYNAMDNEILTVLGVKNTGTEKSSGITSEETLSLNQELELKSNYGLKIRQKFCDDLRAKTGISFTVRLADAFIPKELEKIEDDKDVPEVIKDDE